MSGREETSWWGKGLKDGRLIEGVRHCGEHLQYKPNEGFDLSSEHREEEKTGDGVNPSNTPLKGIKKKGQL